MRKYIIGANTVLIVGLILSLLIVNKQRKATLEDLSITDNNLKAMLLEKDKNSKEIIAYRYEVEQLNDVQDSIIKELNETRKKLKIKDRQLVQMQYFKTEIITKDSIFIKDTIFRENFIKLDTVVQDKWHSLAIQLNPTKLSIQAKYTSDLNVFAKSSKEIIGTPKKCFIGRWFQKKHKVIRVEVIDRNPYSVIKEKKFVIVE